MSRNRRFTGDKSPSDVNRGLSDRITSDRLFPNYTNEQKAYRDTLSRYSTPAEAQRFLDHVKILELSQEDYRKAIEMLGRSPEISSQYLLQHAIYLNDWVVDMLAKSCATDPEYGDRVLRFVQLSKISQDAVGELCRRFVEIDAHGILCNSPESLYATLSSDGLPYSEENISSIQKTIIDLQRDIPAGALTVSDQRVDDGAFSLMGFSEEGGFAIVPDENGNMGVPGEPRYDQMSFLRWIRQWFSR
jgi:hypothetical protein